MRQSSFEDQQGERTAASPVPAATYPQPARSIPWAAIGVAIVAFLAFYREAGAPNPVSVDSSWISVLSHAFAQGWQWGSEIISSYGPLGFLTPYFGWEAETATAFRIGQIVLCGLSALLLFAFARNRSALVQAILVLGLLAWYPLLVMEIGWAIPFVFAVVLIHDMLDPASTGRPRRGVAALIVILLSVLAMTSYNAMLMWVVVVAYAIIASALQRDRRLLMVFGVGAPVAFIALWLMLGQSLSGLVDFVATAAELRRGYAAMSVPAPPYVDVIGFVVMAMLAALLIVVCRTAAMSRRLVLPSLALFALAFLGWRSGFVRADQHVLIYFGTTCFIALAGLSLQAVRGSRKFGVSHVIMGIVLTTCVVVSYGRLGAHWSLSGMSDAVASLFRPDQTLLQRRQASADRNESQQLPRTQARLGSKAVDVLMNESSVALVNGLTYRPRPAYLGYSAYTTRLARSNETHLLGNPDAPEFLLTRLQSIDNRYPTADDPLAVLAALREYLPVDVEKGYLVMQRTGWPIAALEAPPAAAWKVASLGADLVVDQGPKPQALFFDIQLNFWGRLRSALVREPGITMHVKLTDGTEHSFALVRRLGLAGMLVSPFMLTESDYLRWHASISERRVVAMQLRVTDPADVRWFDPVFAYSMVPVELPRVSVDQLSPELQHFLYPTFSPAPTNVQTTRQEVMTENGSEVLFVHAPATLTFAPEPGAWSVSGKFGLLSSAYACSSSDGVALIAERLAADGTVTPLLTRAIDPVHKAAERGAQDFDTGSFVVNAGDKVLLRSAPGLTDEAGTDCDWSYFAAVKFAASR